MQGGLPAGKIVIKPNFVDPDPGCGDGSGGFAAFVARLSHEKGLPTLLRAWEILGRTIPLKIIGNGPLARDVEMAAESNRRIEWRGHQPLSDVYELMGQAKFLVFPSECYETFGRVIVEAFAKGTPVIASRMGAMADLIDHGRTGLLFNPGDAEDLAAQVRRMLANPEALAAMRLEARREYEAKYTGLANHRQMMAVYQQAIIEAAHNQRQTGPEKIPASA